jgi:hypothetical protein
MVEARGLYLEGISKKFFGLPPLAGLGARFPALRDDPSILMVFVGLKSSKYWNWSIPAIAGAATQLGLKLVPAAILVRLRRIKTKILFLRWLLIGPSHLGRSG